MMSSNAAIEAGGLVKRYGERTVVSVDGLTVMEGEVLALLGPNGAGKTTLFRLLALLERPDAGWIKYFGKNVDVHDLDARRRTAAVFQRPLLFQGSVEENVAFGLKFRHISRKEVKKRVVATLDLMGISRLADSDTTTPSSIAPFFRRTRSASAGPAAARNTANQARPNHLMISDLMLG